MIATRPATLSCCSFFGLTPPAMVGSTCHYYPLMLVETSQKEEGSFILRFVPVRRLGFFQQNIGAIC